MNITWTQVKAHVKRNRTRYIVLGGVALGMAIGYSTKRANVNTVAQVAKAAKASYKLAIEGADVVVNVTPKQAETFNVVVDAIQKGHAALPEAFQAAVNANGLPQNLKLVIDATGEQLRQWQQIVDLLKTALTSQGLDLPLGADMAKLIPLAQ